MAAVTADQISIEREAGKIKLELPIFSEAEAAQMSPLSGLKTVAIPASSSNPGSSSEEKAERVSLKVDGPSSAASEKEKSERAQPAAAEAKADSKAKHESEIPVLTSLRAEKKEASGGLEKIVLTLLVLCVVLAGILFGIKRWAERSSKSSKLKTNTKIQILTQHYLGPKKSLAIIQVAGEALLIGITDHNISMLKTLALIDDEVPGVVPKNFSDEFEDDSYSRDDIGGDEESENENFALKGIGEVRDLVSTRLKSLRSN